ncbi:MAG TPA: FkbM family methyltransferase [Chitinophagaceae bacterium]
MLKIISRPISKLLHSFGYTISRTEKLIPSSTDPNWAEKLNIQTIIDIGSNEGQFIKKINEVLPGRKIFAFEPIPYCYNKMVEAIKNIDVTAFNVGLSDAEGSMTINISNNLVSSSFLEMKDLHKTSFPESSYVNQENVSVKKLDDILAKYELKKNILVKLDVQGYEEKVIAGGKKIFEETAAVIVESTFEPFYESQWLFDDIYNHFTNAGFKFMGFTDQENSQKTGIPLFADSIFIRKELVKLVL